MDRCAEFFKQMLAFVLAYNIDKERLEQELRTFLIVRCIDCAGQFSTVVEEALLGELTAFFGPKFNFRMRQVLEQCKEQPVNG